MYLKECSVYNTFLNIKLNDICMLKCVGNLTDCLLYVDDFCIAHRSKSMKTIAC